MKIKFLVLMLFAAPAILQAWRFTLHNKSKMDPNATDPQFNKLNIDIQCPSCDLQHVTLEPEGSYSHDMGVCCLGSLTWTWAMWNENKEDYDSYTASTKAGDGIIPSTSPGMYCGNWTGTFYDADTALPALPAGVPVPAEMRNMMNALASAKIKLRAGE